MQSATHKPFKLSVILLNVVMLSVVMLRVMAPIKWYTKNFTVQGPEPCVNKDL